jgi:hypothetical protein
MGGGGGGTNRQTASDFLDRVEKKKFLKERMKTFPTFDQINPFIRKTQSSDL